MCLIPKLCRGRAVALAWGIVLAGDLAAQTVVIGPPLGQAGRSPYLQLATPTSMTVAWRTLGTIDPVVCYGASPDALEQRVTAGTKGMVHRAVQDEAGGDVLPLHSPPAGTHQYEARLTLLSPDTLYYYGVYDGDTLLAGADLDHYFRTPPLAGTEKPMRFWVVGDGGEGSPNQRQAFVAMLNYAIATRRPIDAYLHLGDMAYEIGADGEFQANFFEVYAELLRNTVTWPTMGNHEGYSSDGETGTGPYYDAYVLPTRGEAGGLASGTEGYYSFDVGAIHFVVLNSYDVPREPSEAMAAWLRADLEATAQKWLIAFWHHPPYTKGTHNSDTEVELVEMREYFMPILEAHGVDLVLGGHSHVYERSMLIDSAYDTPTHVNGVILDDGDGDPEGEGAYRKSANLNPHEGTVAIVAGHGSGAGAFGRSPIMRQTITETGSLILDIDGEAITGRMLNLDGQVRDTFQIVKRGTVPERLPVENPWQPIGPRFATSERVFGEIEVRMFATPSAPDAEIFYTLDGSDPDAFAQRYVGPLRFDQVVTLKAMSVWRGGTRHSPIETFQWSSPRPSQERVLRVPVEYSVDDGVESLQDGSVALDGPLLELGTDRAVAVRFRELSIPRGATILESYIQFGSAGTEFSATSLQFAIDEAGDSPPLGEGPLAITSRAVHADTVEWVTPGWVDGWRSFSQRSLNLRPLVQRVVDAPDWQPGQTLGFRVTGEGMRTAYSFDGDPSLAPELQVRYVEADSVALSVSQPMTIDFGFGTGADEPVSRIEWRRLRHHAELGLEFRLECSQTLSEGSWEEMKAMVETSYESLFWERVDLHFKLPPPRRGPWFVRMRISRSGE